MRNNRSWSGAWLAVGLAACSPDTPHAIEGIGDAAARGADAAIGDGGAPLDPEPAGFGVVATDYSVTSIALLDADGAMRKRDFVNSGSATAGLVTALSGDVTLPTRSDHGVLTLIDRFRTDVVTRIDLASGKVLGQVKTQPSNMADDDHAYSSNPQDYVQIDASTAWLSRYEPNQNAKATAADQGIDLLRIDPTRFERSDESIDFSGFNGSAQRTNPDSGETERVVVYARPSRIVRLGHYLVVGLESLNATFDAAGEGMVALVDLDARHAEKVALPGLQSCGQVVPVPDDATRVAVACTGVYFTGDRRATAGLAMLALEHGKLVIEHVWHAADDPDSAVTCYGLIALNAHEVVSVAAGDKQLRDADGKVVHAATHDVLYRVDLVTGAQHALFEAAGRYVLGDGAFNPRRDLLLVPDASSDAHDKPTAGVWRFERGKDGEFEAVDMIKIDDILPPIEVKPLD